MYKRYLSPFVAVTVLLIILSFTFSGCNSSAEEQRKLPYHIDTSSLPMLPTGYQSPRYHGLPQKMSSAKELTPLFDSTKSDLISLRETGLAKPFIFKNLPPDLRALPTKEKTHNFIALLTPHILEVNEDILRVRTALFEIKERQKTDSTLSEEEQLWITSLAKMVRVKEPTIDKLLYKINTIPVSLVIAQSINESGWGTSRFARDGNALFGQHASKNGKLKYILSKSGTARVAAFDDIYLSTASYILNLNRHAAYKKLRALRQQQIDRNEEVSGTLLATGLLSYSARGQEYVNELQFLIRKYQLEKLNSCILDTTAQLSYYQFTR